MVALIFGVYRHRSNIQRLLQGEERKLSFRERQRVTRA